MDENRDILLIDQTFKNIEFIFRYAGINIRSGIQKTTNVFWSRFIFIAHLVGLDISLYGEINWFIDGVRSGKDFLDLTYIAPCISISTMTNIKGILFVLNEKFVHKLIENLREMEMREKETVQSNEKRKIKEEGSKFLNYVMSTLTSLYGAVCIGYGLTPLLFMALKYKKTGEVEASVPFLVLYWFDWYDLRIWPFVYFIQIWGELAVSLIVCSADFFYFTSCICMRIQFQLLQHDLANIITAEGNLIVCEDEEFRRKFKDLILWHQSLLECAEILEKIYSTTTLCNFITSSLMICLTGFNVTMADNAAIILVSISFLFMSLVQIYFLCYFADLLAASSMEVGAAVYNSDWYKAEPKIGKQLLIMQTRSQKPCTLTASGYAEVNLNAFMRILSTSWSYFALLQTMYRN